MPVKAIACSTTSLMEYAVIFGFRSLAKTKREKSSSANRRLLERNVSHSARYFVNPSNSVPLRLVSGVGRTP
jgi:hypothetical protein